MCGICLSISHKKDLNKQTIEKMLSSIHHRGPDEQGMFIRKERMPHIILGVKRLSIIDIQNGSQPIYNEDKSIALVMNGEIYNYRSLRDDLKGRGHGFRTDSDTEVLVHLYEEYATECLQHINGMFSFALWDNKNEALFIARDRLGKKPLYFTRIGEILYFSSEIKAFLNIPGFSSNIDVDALDHYLTYQYIPQSMCVYKNVLVFPPAHFAIVKEDKVQPIRYWSFDMEKKTDIPYEDAKQKIRELLKEAVSLRMNADVPVGVFLSGGIDSSILTGIMSGLSKNAIRTFSVGFENAVSESYHARSVSEYFQTDHSELIVKPGNGDILKEISQFYDQPFSDTSMMPTYILCRFAKENIKVAVSGDGGDENFGGYFRYLLLKRSEKVKPCPLFPKTTTLNLLNKMPEYRIGRKNVLIFLKKIIYSSDMTLSEKNVLLHCIFNNDEKHDVYSDNMRSQLSDKNTFSYLSDIFDNAPANGYLDKAIYSDIASYLPDCLLIKADISSMANSLELRSPFLDHHLVEFSASLPPEWKIRGARQKHILKDAYSDLLPAGIIKRQKQGFGIPVDDWFRNEWKEIFADTVFSQKAHDRGFFNMDKVRDLFNDHISGRISCGMQLHCLLMLELWMKNGDDV